jgi:signal transduction histidine kinase
MDSFETTIYSAILISGAIIGIIILYFAITIIRNHRRHFRMLSQNFLAEMELLEKERNRIARDLHDELGPLLSVTQIHIHAAEGVGEKDNLHLKKAGENISELTQRFGGIAKNLTPKILAAKGLREALQEFLEQYNNTGFTKLEFSYQVSSVLTAEASLHIYRIIQELVHNAMKHSGAATVNIQVKERRGKLYLYYRDDGIGFDVKDPLKEVNGLGLSSMKNRVVMLNGKMSCESEVKKGTEYFFEIPVKKKL